VVGLEISRLSLSQQLLQRTQRVGSLQQRSNAMPPQDPADRHLRLHSKVDHTRGGSQKCRCAKNSSPASSRREDHPCRFSELLRERKLERAEARFSHFRKDFSDRLSFAALDLGIEIDKRTTKPPSDSPPHGRLSRAGKTDEDEVRTTRPVRGFAPRCVRRMPRDFSSSLPTSRRRISRASPARQ